MALNQWMIACLLGVGCIEAGRILFLPPIMSPSHKLLLLPWADELASKGHEVVMWSPSVVNDKYVTKVAKTVQFIVKVDDPAVQAQVVNMNDSFITWLTWEVDYTIPSEIIALEMSAPFVESLLTNYRDEFDKIVNQKWDLIIFDEIFNVHAYLIAALTKAPVAIISTTPLTAPGMNYMGAPNPPSVFPIMGVTGGFSDQMTLFQRMQNTFQYTFHVYFDRFMTHRATNRMRVHFPDLPELSTVRSNPHFLFINYLQALDFARPLLPNMMYVGGMHVKNNFDPISEELGAEIKASEGFILISMGHIVNWDIAPQSAYDAFVGALSRIPHKYLIIWQYKAQKIPTSLPNNIKLMKWLPQQALLNHPKLKAFVSHCGCNGAIEAAFAGAPVLGIPFFGDQMMNADRFVARGGGIRVNKVGITSDALYDGLMKLINDPSYKRNMKVVQSVALAQMNSPLEKAVFWTEFVLNNTDNNYLRPDAVHELYLFQYYCLDVIVILLLLLYLFVKVTKKLFCKCISLVCKSKPKAKPAKEENKLRKKKKQ